MLSKEKIYNYIEDLEDKAKASDRFFQERNDLYIENQQLKKQKDDVVEYIKSKKEQLHHSFDEPDWDYLFICNPDDLLRMLGEIE